MFATVNGNQSGGHFGEYDHHHPKCPLFEIIMAPRRCCKLHRKITNKKSHDHQHRHEAAQPSSAPAAEQVQVNESEVQVSKQPDASMAATEVNTDISIK